jgi:hypothetical protein
MAETPKTALDQPPKVPVALIPSTGKCIALTVGVCVVKAMNSLQSNVKPIARNRQSNCKEFLTRCNESRRAIRIETSISRRRKELSLVGRETCDVLARRMRDGQRGRRRPNAGPLLSR